jgi:hypothetical protein
MKTIAVVFSGLLVAMQSAVISADAQAQQSLEAVVPAVPNPGWAIRLRLTSEWDSAGVYIDSRGRVGVVAGPRADAVIMCSTQIMSPARVAELGNMVSDIPRFIPNHASLELSSHCDDEGRYDLKIFTVGTD